MITEWWILVLFLLVAIIALIEDYIPTDIKKWLYIAFGIVLVLVAGLREVGVDPDSQVYQRYIQHSMSYNETFEYSFVLIANAVGFLTDNALLGIFLLYAILGVSTKLIAFNKYGDMLILMLLSYISFFYPLCELTQIRSGVLGGCYLIALYYQSQDMRWRALFFILLGSIFHYSGLALLAILFLSSKPLTQNSKIFWAVIVAACYLISSIVYFNLHDISIPYIGSKLNYYQTLAENVHYQEEHELFNFFQFVTIGLFYYWLIFSDKITEHLPAFPLLLKSFGIGLCCHALLFSTGFIGERIFYEFIIVMPILIPTIVYTIRPRIGGVIIVILLNFYYLNYMCRYVFRTNDILPFLPQ